MDAVVAAAVATIIAAVSGASAGIVKLMLDHQSKERDADRVERARDRMTWENHLSGSVGVQKDTVIVLTKMNDRLDTISDKLDK